MDTEFKVEKTSSTHLAGPNEFMKDGWDYLKENGWELTIVRSLSRKGLSVYELCNEKRLDSFYFNNFDNALEAAMFMDISKQLEN